MSRFRLGLALHILTSTTKNKHQWMRTISIKTEPAAMHACAQGGKPLSGPFSILQSVLETVV